MSDQENQGISEAFDDSAEGGKYQWRLELREPGIVTTKRLSLRFAESVVDRVQLQPEYLAVFNFGGVEARATGKELRGHIESLEENKPDSERLPTYREALTAIARANTDLGNDPEKPKIAEFGPFDGKDI